MQIDEATSRQFIAPYQVRRPPLPCSSGHLLHHSRSGPLYITAIGVDEMEAVNRPLAGSEIHARVDLKYVRDGGMTLFARDQAIRVRPGEMILVDYEETFSFQTSPNTDSICVTIPKYWLLRHNPSFRHALFATLTGDRPFFSSMRAFLNDWVVASEVPHHLIGGQFGGLLTLILKAHESTATLHRAKLAADIIAFVHERCCDAGLTADAVAVALGISRRNLYAVLADAGTTFGKEVIGARLEISRNILTNPSFDNLQIGEIAYVSGFLDQGHFSRRFRSRYGQSPQALRQDRKV